MYIVVEASLSYREENGIEIAEMNEPVLLGITNSIKKAGEYAGIRGDTSHFDIPVGESYTEYFILNKKTARTIFNIGACEEE